MMPPTPFHTQQLPWWPKRRSSPIVGDPSTDSSTSSDKYQGNIKMTYIILLVVWCLLICGLGYFSYRRYKRRQAMREQQQQEEEEEANQRIRPLTKAEINTLKVATLTEADIQKSRRLAQPASIHSTYHSAESLHTAHMRTSLPTPTSSQAELTAPEPARIEETRRGQMSAMLQRAKSTPLLKLLRQQSVSRKSSASSFIADIHEENCAVCLDDFVAGDKVRQLPCKHYFHKTCIDPWLGKNSGVCPLCNFNVSEGFTD